MGSFLTRYHLWIPSIKPIKQAGSCVPAQLPRARRQKSTWQDCSALLLTIALVMTFGSSVSTKNADKEKYNKPLSITSQQALVNEYCTVCHNDDLKIGNFSWTELDLKYPERNLAQAEKVIRKLRSGMMPPDEPRPISSELEAFALALESRIDEIAEVNPYAGSPELHRINRREYRNSIRDLLGIDVDVNALLPPDGRTGNFDNMADALTVTPALMQAYIRAADKISRQALGDPKAPPVMANWNVPKVVNQMRHVEGTPFGTRGGTSGLYNFPADGDYTFSLELHYYYTGELIGSNLPESLQSQEIEISIDGKHVWLFTVDPLQEESSAVMKTEPVAITAGPHQVAAAFISKFDGPLEDQYRLVEHTLLDSSIALHAGMTALPHLQTMTITGPLKISGISDTPSRKRIFTCYPENTDEEETCAREIIANLSGLAFRRPTTFEDLKDLMEMYQIGRANGDFEDGIRAVIQTTIAKPEFIFRFERIPENIQPGENYRISNLELASRLSYFLWGTAPDADLINVAVLGELGSDAVLEKQVRNMLEDPRAETLANNFAAQWLRLTGIEEIHPEPTIFPDYTRNLAQAMRREVELVFQDIVREDNNVLDLLTSDYTYVNETLARHYNFPNVLGNRFRRVKLNDPNRFGLLGKGAILTSTSLANRTSPVARGKYVLEVLIGSSPPPPPAEVPPFKESVNNQKTLTVRERMVEHRANPSCNACHKIMDPIGLTMENFDAIGRWRLNDSGSPIDPSSEMYDGTKLDGPSSLRQAVLNRSEAFLGTFTENLLSYGVGRVLDYRDMPIVRSIKRDAAKENNRFSSFVLGVVKSEAFRMRTLVQEADE